LSISELNDSELIYKERKVPKFLPKTIKEFASLDNNNL